MKKIKINVYKSNFAMFKKGLVYYSWYSEIYQVYKLYNVKICPSTKGNLNNHFLGKWNK